MAWLEVIPTLLRVAVSCETLMGQRFCFQEGALAWLTVATGHWLGSLRSPSCGSDPSGSLFIMWPLL